MATKWIKVPVTLHVPGKNFKPFKWDSNGGVVEGNYDIVEVPPLTPVELDAEEADRLLARFADAGGAEATAEEIAALKAGGKKTKAALVVEPAPASDAPAA